MRTLKIWSLSRISWFLLMCGSIGAIAFAYYTQIYTGDMPCYYCILDRYYLTWIALAGLVGIIKPKFWLFRFIAIVIFGYGAISGIVNGIEHLNYLHEQTQVALNHMASFTTCPTTVDFIVPLQQWLPDVYTPVGNCNTGGPMYFGFNLVQLTTILFVCLSIAVILIIVSQFWRIAPKSGFHTPMRKLF